MNPIGILKIVTVPPHIDGPPLEDIVFVEEQPLNLQCITDGIPAPKMRWMKDKKPLIEVPEHIELLNDNHFVYVEELRENDAGAYTCIAENAAGKAEKTFQVRVIVGPKFLDEGKPQEFEA